jgi:hypothetical protein
VIPEFSRYGKLPPYVGRADSFGDRSPYPTTMREFVARFGTSPDRCELLRHFLAYRRALWEVGLRGGFQWVNGSFVEDSERVRCRSPSDLDVVTFAPILSLSEDHAVIASCMKENVALFTHDSVKSAYRCDAYFVDTSLLSTERIVASAAYWCSLFGHDRDKVWKGFVRIDLADDVGASQYLEVMNDSLS